MSALYEITVEDSSGDSMGLDRFRNQVLLVVNTASRCGFTPQYEGLQQLHDRYQSQGFSVLAFPCNQFGQQEPGNNAEIVQFCQTHYHVTFPVLGKIEVNGANAHPLFRYLKQQAPGMLGSRCIKWNFTKFLIDRNGTVVRRYGPLTTPKAIERDLQRLL